MSTSVSVLYECPNDDWRWRSDQRGSWASGSTELKTRPDPLPWRRKWLRSQLSPPSSFASWPPYETSTTTANSVPNHIASCYLKHILRHWCYELISGRIVPLHIGKLVPYRCGWTSSTLDERVPHYMFWDHNVPSFEIALQNKRISKGLLASRQKLQDHSLQLRNLLQINNAYWAFYIFILPIS